MTSAPPANLRSLLVRMAAGDRAALRILHATLRENVGDQARRTLSRAEDVRAVVQATFVEVWWLSRFHSEAGTDVLAWVNGIAAQRAAERSRALSAADLHQHDDVSRVALAGLLGTAPATGPT